MHNYGLCCNIQGVTGFFSPTSLIFSSLLFKSFPHFSACSNFYQQYDLPLGVTIISGMKTFTFRSAYTERKISLEISDQSQFLLFLLYRSVQMRDLNKLGIEKLIRLLPLWFQSAGDGKLQSPGIFTQYHCCSGWESLSTFGLIFSLVLENQPFSLTLCFFIMVPCS